MKIKKMILPVLLLCALIVLFFFFDSRQSLVSADSLQNEESTFFSDNLENNSDDSENIFDNLTISEAMNRYKIDPNFWDSESEFADSETILFVNGGFLKGEMEDSKDGKIYNSDLDPNSATLGEIRAAISEYNND